MNFHSAYSTYSYLVYFRWKALIRSQEYREFYDTERVDDEIEFKNDIDKQIEEKEISLISDEYEAISLEEFINSVKKGQPSPLASDSSFIRECEELLEWRKVAENSTQEIRNKAKKRFGLIASDISDLIMVDKQPEKLQITFEEYKPRVPTINSSIEVYDAAIQELTDSQNGLDIFFSQMEGYRYFRINPSMPIGIITEAIKKKLRVKENQQKRKEFDSWEEAFNVWDKYQYAKEELKVKNYLLKTAELMSKEDASSYWNLNSASKQALKDRVRDKVKVAKKLIRMAGKGQFIRL